MTALLTWLLPVALAAWPAAEFVAAVAADHRDPVRLRPRNQED